MACGENPKRVYGEKGGPSTRMGNVAGYRAAFIDAAAYRDKRAKGGGDDDKDNKRDLKLETLAGVLDGDILVHIHCYRADEMATMIDRSEEHTSELQSLMRISYAVFCLTKTKPTPLTTRTHKKH